MKEKLKYLIAALLSLVIVFGFAVHAGAEEYGTVNVTESDGEIDAEILTENNVPAVDRSPALYFEEETLQTETDASAITDEDAANDGEKPNFFTKVYTELSCYASEILSALTLIGSLTLALAYKKGLLPLVEKSLLTIGGAITKIKESTKESADMSSALGDIIDEKLTTTKETVDLLANRIKELDDRLSESIKDEKDAMREKRQLSLIVNAQIEMLYDVFMCSALPQYQKDAVGEKIARMKEALAENEGEN